MTTTGSTARAASCRAAFTLFELIVVMAVILIILAIASPLLLNQLHSDAKITAAADTVRARWADCRSQSVEENRPYRFAVVPNSGKYKIEPYDAGTDGGSSDNIENSFIMEDRLPTGVRFGTKDFPVDPSTEEPDTNDYRTVAVFQPDGTAKDDVEITFGSGSGETVTVRLRALTGSVSTVRPDQEGK
jgi:prepilin-type N-terminal cleavage/methylation domain-containing protein